MNFTQKQPSVRVFKPTQAVCFDLEQCLINSKDVPTGLLTVSRRKTAVDCVVLCLSRYSTGIGSGLDQKPFKRGRSLRTQRPQSAQKTDPRHATINHAAGKHVHSVQVQNVMPLCLAEACTGVPSWNVLTASTRFPGSPSFGISEAGQA